MMMQEAELSSEVNENEHGLPPGFRFHPTDEELITFYLASKVFHGSFCGVQIAEIDLNRCEPWDLPDVAKMGEKEWYFFSLRDRKYPTGLRTNRATGAGYWKATGKDREVYSTGGGRQENTSTSMLLLGMKKTLVFYKGRAPKGEKTKWVMHEYRLDGHFSYRHGHRNRNNNSASKEEWVICRIYHKSAAAGEKKNGLFLHGLQELAASNYNPAGSLSEAPPLPLSSCSCSWQSQPPISSPPPTCCFHTSRDRDHHHHHDFPNPPPNHNFLTNNDDHGGDLRTILTHAFNHVDHESNNGFDADDHTINTNNNYLLQQCKTELQAAAAAAATLNINHHHHQLWPSSSSHDQLHELPPPAATFLNCSHLQQQDHHHPIPASAATLLMNSNATTMHPQNPFISSSSGFHHHDHHDLYSSSSSSSAALLGNFQSATPPPATAFNNPSTAAFHSMMLDTAARSSCLGGDSSCSSLMMTTSTWPAHLIN